MIVNVFKIGFAVLWLASEDRGAPLSCFDGPDGRYTGRHALLLVAPSRVDVAGFPLFRAMSRSRSRVSTSRARAQAFYMLREAVMIVYTLYFVIDRMLYRIYE